MIPDLVQNPAVQNRISHGSVHKHLTVEPVAPPRDYLYTSDNGSDGVVLLVDSQEWGGDRVGLGELVRLIDRVSLNK